jgi:hypothetical protein
VRKAIFLYFFCLIGFLDLTDAGGREKREKQTVSSRVCMEAENWAAWLAARQFRATAVCGRIGPCIRTIN